MPSTVVKSIVYDPEQKQLKIGYVSGVWYLYKEVPETIYLELKQSKSKGFFLNKKIKGKFEYEKIG